VTGEHRAGFRDHVLYAMALGTGLCAHELVALDVGDVFDDAGRVRCRVRLRVFKGDAGAEDDRQEVLLSNTLRAKAGQATRVEGAWRREPRPRRSALREPARHAALDAAAPARLRGR
jgi:integrase/recombinase XerC